MFGKKSQLLYSVVSFHSRRAHSRDKSQILLDVLAKMPKVNSPRITEAQRQRQKISKKSEKYGPSTVYIQVLGSGARGAPNSLLLFTDQKRYLFNCGECTQRISHEHKVKLSRLENIFITNKTWGNIGGLPGLSLTLQDVGVPKITLHGPEGLDELYHATRRFVIMKDMNISMAKCNPLEDYEDNVMSVRYVVLGPNDFLLNNETLKPTSKKAKQDCHQQKEFAEFMDDDTDYYTAERKQEIKEKKKNTSPTREIAKKTEKVLHNLTKKSPCTIAFICTIKKRLGTLDFEKCVEKGVKPGPLLGQLKNGLDVVLPDGTLVLAKDVKTPDIPGPVMIVLEVPEISYLQERDFEGYFDNADNPPENIPTLIVHYTPPHVLNHDTYRAFMAKFGPTTHHLILNNQNTCMGSEEVHRNQHKLHLLDPDIFPILRDVSIPPIWNNDPPLPKMSSPSKIKALEELKKTIALAQFQNIINTDGTPYKSVYADARKAEDEENKMNIIAGRTLTVFNMVPKKQLDRSQEPKLHVQNYIQEAMGDDGFIGSLERFRNTAERLKFSRQGTHKEYPKVIFLGTGSCIPSKARNTSGILLQIDEERSMLLDCGEGTFTQLVRFFGPKRVDSFLRTLKAIYVSHLHADHHIGLINVLQARQKAFENKQPSELMLHEPVYLLAPGQIMSWLSLYDQQFERIMDHLTLIPNQNLIQDKLTSEEGLTSAVLAQIGVQNIETCLVTHCPNAFGVSVQVDQMNKITYSGDTIPCPELVNLGKDSTLLIHEATMEDDLAEEARTKMHTTTSQAIHIGQQMSARYTILTHFSQRYARLPRLNASILNDNNSVGIAFDNMQITMGDLDILPHMYAPLQLMFAEHCVEMEMKAQHRELVKKIAQKRISAEFPSAGAGIKPNKIRNFSTIAETMQSNFESNESIANPCISNLESNDSQQKSPHSNLETSENHLQTYESRIECNSSLEASYSNLEICKSRHDNVSPSSVCPKIEGIDLDNEDSNR